jgi:hypothetical protein
MQADPATARNSSDAPPASSKHATLRTSAARDAALATLGSRLLVWGAGLLATVTAGVISAPSGLTLPGVTSGLGSLGDRLVSPFARWDANWYLLIANHGYQPATSPSLTPRAAFFPLYPLLINAAGSTGLPLVVAGALISTACLGLALYGLHRLVELEGHRSPRWAHPDAARMTVLCLAFAPMAVFFSAVYSDALYLALSVGAFLYARRGRWALAGVLGAFAASARATGVILVLPLAILYLYGPREDRAPREGRPPQEGRAPRAVRSLAPRYRIRLDAAWLALVPTGLLAFMLYLWLAGAGPLASFDAETVWGHHSTFPLVGLWDGVRAGFDDFKHLLSGSAHLQFLSTDPATAVDTGWQNLMPLAALVVGLVAAVGVARTLPFAYSLYVIVGLALPLSAPVLERPLQSLPRYETVLFPLFMWTGLWLARRPRWRGPGLAMSAALAALFAAEFATWHFVA